MMRRLGGTHITSTDVRFGHRGLSLTRWSPSSPSWLRSASNAAERDTGDPSRVLPSRTAHNESIACT